MGKIISTYIILFILTISNCYCQYRKKLDSLCLECSHITSDSEKIVQLDKIAEYYFIYKLNHEGDSILQEELSIADTSNNPNLKFTALFGNSILKIGVFSNSENFEKSIAFLRSGIEYATTQNRYDYVSQGYSRLSFIFRQRGLNDSALQNAKMALESFTYITNDSLKAMMYMELGQAYAANGDMVVACKNYNIAFDFALNINSIPLQAEVHKNIAEIYRALNQDKEATQELLKGLALSQENGYRYGVLEDYFNLARITDNIIYINKAIEEANYLDDAYYTLASKRLMLSYIQVKEKDSKKALAYLESENDLDESYKNAGPAIYNIAIANTYLYGEKPDSALKYFKLSEKDITSNYEHQLVIDLYYNIAATYQKLKDNKNAINYYLKVFELVKKQNDVSSLADVSSNLSALYSETGNYKEAYKYSSQSIDFNAVVQKKSNNNEITLLEVVRENREHEEELKLHEITVNRNRNMQYLIISISICIAFLVMIVLGSFPISKSTIRFVGYFFFISLFEFLVMIIDNMVLYKAVHNQPLVLWIIKIGLIACLVPVQHFLEHNLIQFLQSKKLLEARTRLSIKRIRSNLFGRKPQKENEMEEDTAIL